MERSIDPLVPNGSSHIISTGWKHHPVPMSSFWYRVVLSTGTKGSFMSYFKCKISLFLSRLLCRWDGKGGTHETGGYSFESVRSSSCFDIFFNQKYFGTWWSLHPVLSGLGAGSLTRVLGYRFKNWYLKTLPTNAYSLFSSSGYGTVCNVDYLG